MRRRFSFVVPSPAGETEDSRFDAQRYLPALGAFAKTARAGATFSAKTSQMDAHVEEWSQSSQASHVSISATRYA